MTVILHQATPVTTIADQAHIYYQWLTVCNQFTLLSTSGNWSTSKSNTNGYTAITGDPDSNKKFYSASFDGTETGYIAIRDDNYPENTTIGQIVSSSGLLHCLVLDTSVHFPTTSANITWVVFDPSISPPVFGNYFVIENPVVGQPKWQALCTVGAGCVEWMFAPLGPTIAVSYRYYMKSALDLMFGVSSPDQGWFYTWVENGELTGIGDAIGGAAPSMTLTDAAGAFTSADIGRSLTLTGSMTAANNGTFTITGVTPGTIVTYTNANGIAETFSGIYNVTSRTALWLGSLQPLHASGVSGTPQDTCCAAIFGSTTGDIENVSRVTSTPNNLCIGEIMASDFSTMTPVYFAQKRLFSGTDVCSNVFPALNARTGVADDYDVIAVTVSGDYEQTVRGVVPGVRMLNDGLENRTLISDGSTYVVQNGIGSMWIPTRPVV